jgi:hypothetical protein
MEGYGHCSSPVLELVPVYAMALVPVPVPGSPQVPVTTHLGILKHAQDRRQIQNIDICGMERGINRTYA